MTNVVMFCFGGRRANMELQIPFIRKVLELHPQVKYDLWNLAHNPEDHQYLNSIKGDRIEVKNDFYGNGERPWEHFNDVFRYYATEAYRDTLFVKVDDDVVFMQPDRFDEFIDSVKRYPGSIVSAKTINNGACTQTEPGLWRGFRTISPSVRLLDVHLSGAYAEMSHNYFFDHWEDLVDQEVAPIFTEDWLSINLIGYDWRTGCKIARRVGGTSPGYISGRRFRRSATMGDEGMCNTLPRVIMQGFLACHLNFGPQERSVSDEQLTLWRKRYAEIGTQYLDEL